jgi:3-methylcrotonyl-CoA carboxylase alpha subunit
MTAMKRMTAVPAPPVRLTRVGEGVYRVESDGRAEIVYVAGVAGDPWAFWNGHVYRGRLEAEPATRRGVAGREATEGLVAPMPATVRKVAVRPGSVVAKGDVIIILEAMKMEMTVRAPHDATVVAVHCREGELVQPDTILVDLR